MWSSAFRGPTAVPDMGVDVWVRHEARRTPDGTEIVYTCVVDGPSEEACASVEEQVNADFNDVIAALGKAAAR